MRLRLPICLSSLVLLLVFPVVVFASGFQLKTIGDMSVDGVTYDQLWYSSGDVTFTGIAGASEAVTIVIDGTSSSVTSGADGNWNYSTTLAEGDHVMSFASSGGSVAFTLTIGATPEGVGALTPAETPTVGVSWPTMTLIASGMGLLVLAVVYRRSLV